MSAQSPPYGAAGRKLPLGHTIMLAFASYFENFTDVLRATWLWIVLIGPLSYFAAWQQAVWMGTILAGIRQGTPPQVALASRPMDVMLVGHLDSVLSFIAGVSIAVAWHRRVILDERPGLSGSNLASASLWRYVGSGLLIFLIAGAPLLLLLLAQFLLGFSILGLVPGQPLPGWFLPVMIAFFVFYFGAMVVVMRLILVFPAADDIGLTFTQAWHRSKGSTWRMFWGILVCSVAPVLVFFLVLLSVGGNPAREMLTSGVQPHRSAAFAAVTLVFYLLLLPVGIGFLSHAYLFLVRPAAGPHPEEPAEA